MLNNDSFNTIFILSYLINLKKKPPRNNGGYTTVPAIAAVPPAMLTELPVIVEMVQPFLTHIDCKKQFQLEITGKSEISNCYE